MSDWMGWIATAGVVVILEIFSGTFYLLMIAVGLVDAAAAAALGASPEWQYIVAAVVGAGATLALHKSKYGLKKNAGNPDAKNDPNVNMDVGQTIQVQSWQGQAEGVFTTRAMYRGAMWDVETRASRAAPGVFTIYEVQGSRLLVKGTHEV
jgi:membrane protein implicated in regulation of membrane protease activity